MASVGSDVSGWFLATAIAGIGMKTQLRELITVGLKPAVLMVGETVFIALLVLALLPGRAASVDASLMNRYYDFDMTRAGATSGLLVIAGGAPVDYLGTCRGVRRLRILVGSPVCYFALLLLAFQLPPGNAQLLAVAAAFLTGSAFVGTSGVIVTAVSPAAMHASAFWLADGYRRLCRCPPVRQVGGCRGIPDPRPILRQGCPGHLMPWRTRMNSR